METLWGLGARLFAGNAKRYERGFKVVFGSNVTATDDPEMQEPKLAVLRKGFARMMAAEEILTELG